MERVPSAPTSTISIDIQQQTSCSSTNEFFQCHFSDNPAQARGLQRHMLSKPARAKKALDWESAGEVNKATTVLHSDTHSLIVIMLIKRKHCRIAACGISKTDQLRLVNSFLVLSSSRHEEHLTLPRTCSPSGIQIITAEREIQTCSPPRLLPPKRNSQTSSFSIVS